MTTVILNLNDVVILITVFQCLILGTIIMLLGGIKFYQRILLGLFLYALAADFADTLIYWAEPVKERLLAYSPLLFFALKPLSFLAPPLLFLYVKSTLFSDFKLRAIHLAHGLPFLLMFVGVSAFVATHSTELMTRYILDYNALYETRVFHYYVNAKHVVFLSYGAAAFEAVRIYYRNIENEYSSTKHIGQEWIRLLIVGFFAIWALYYLSYLGSAIIENEIFSTTMGLTGNYFSLIFINILIAYGLTRSSAFGGVRERGHSLHDTDQKEAKSEAVYHKIRACMDQENLYLDPELSLERLAQEVEEPLKTTSTAINRYYGKNFFEMINSYRIEKAKELIRSDGQLSMQQVMELSGFNSKATFNRCFKKEAECTPSEYKKKGLKASP
jgi:AraC-like DNA-binding protein